MCKAVVQIQLEKYVGKLSSFKLFLNNKYKSVTGLLMWMSKIKLLFDILVICKTDLNSFLTYLKK